jgi:hypothetical protein
MSMNKIKSLHILQPYAVGSKNAKSLAIVLPAKIVRKNNINVSTVFALRADEKTRRITLQALNEIIEKQENLIPADESLEASRQQILSKFSR